MSAGGWKHGVAIYLQFHILHLQHSQVQDAAEIQKAKKKSMQQNLLAKYMKPKCVCAKFSQREQQHNLGELHNVVQSNRLQVFVVVF